MSVRSVIFVLVARFAAGNGEESSKLGMTAVEEVCTSCATQPSAEDVGLLQLTSRDREQQAGTTACTPSGGDPYASGHKTECCSGLQSCLGHW
eukprot:CAMPEP_0115424034 /NCGR_PEP_ID=MMETSP0271-20121206/27621_1 /TAXON_ID=71861 /ORGANISM="Scrippsiella trochoidea, Strain CCMP3099" /LENGTH=92 /DNA_ID=CAMNT_0002848819 /DNA_START=26 /DNA_END=301 /DNA_ORIENTATION=+